ncbi:MAG: SURF1 family protein [bacterium]
MNSPTQYRFQWQPNSKILLFAAFFLPITISLGFWQLDRAEQKEAILLKYEGRLAAEPVDFSTVDHRGDRQYQQVYLNGVVASAPVLLLDNRVRHGRPGYEVFSLVRSQKRNVLVNRGWIETGLDRSQLPSVPQLGGAGDEIALSGYLYRSPGKQVMLGEDNWEVDSAVAVIQNADPDFIGERLKQAMYPYHLRIDPALTPLDADWQIVNVSPAKHIGYAVQWFAMAFALVILTLFASSNLAERFRSQSKR